MAKYKRKRKYPTGGPIVPEPVFLSNGGNPPIKNYTLNIGNRSFNVPVPDFKRLKDKWANLNDAEKMAALGLTAGSAAIYDEVENRKLQQEETGLGYQNNRRVKASFNYGGIPHDPPYVDANGNPIEIPVFNQPANPGMMGDVVPQMGILPPDPLQEGPTGGVTSMTPGVAKGKRRPFRSLFNSGRQTSSRGIPDAIFNYGGELGTDPPFTKAEFEQGMVQGIPNNAISLSGNKGTLNDEYQLYLGENRIPKRNLINNALTGLGVLGASGYVGSKIGSAWHNNKKLPQYHQDYQDYIDFRNSLSPQEQLMHREYANVDDFMLNTGRGKNEKTKHNLTGAFTGLITGLPLSVYANKGLDALRDYRRLKQAKEFRAAKKAADNYTTQANGGYMQYANGGDMGQFSSVPVTEFNNGGTHEANPLGGIPQGPNALVEEGELKIKIPGTDQDFIVSPKIKLDKATAQEFGLPMKYVGKNMVDIFNKVLARKNFNQREGDSITNTTMQDNIAPYIEAHDYLTEKKNAEEEAMRQESFAADMDNMMTEYPDYMQALMAQQQPQQGPSPEEQAMMEQQMMAQQGAPQEMPMMGMGGMMEYKNGGLWANIHAKRARIEAGSGEKMRTPGSKGAPTEEALRESQKAMGGYLYASGGKIPKNILRSRVEAHMSPAEADNYVKNYMGGGYLYENGGYRVSRSNKRKGKTHVVERVSDGVKKYFGDPNLKNKPGTKAAKSAKARHKKNLNKNPFFRAYWNATWKHGGLMYENGGYNNAGFKALPDYVQAKIKGNSMANGGYNYADFMMPGVPVQGVAASNYRYGGRYGCAPRKDFGGFMRGLGEAGYGVLQGTLSSIPGVGQFVDPLMEKGRVALQDATGATEEDIRKGEVISSIGNITGSLVTGNPAAALGQADEVADIARNVGPSDNANNETRKNLDAAANYIDTAGRFLPMLSKQIGKNKAPKGTLEGIDPETGLAISVNPNLPYMYGGRKRYAYGGALSQPIKLMTYPHNQMIMANGGTIPPEDLEYIKQIIAFERKHGAADGTGLKDAAWTHGKAGIASGNDDDKAAQFIYDNYVKPLEKLNLPVDVRKRAVDMYLNSEDPRASLMVAAGLITPKEKLELYNIKNPETNKGMINPKDLDKLWEKHGDATIAFAQSENAAELFDAEKHRSYGKGSTYNKSWGPRIDQWQDDYKYENWKPNKYYKQDEGKKTFSRVAPNTEPGDDLTQSEMPEDWTPTADQVMDAVDAGIIETGTSGTEATKEDNKKIYNWLNKSFTPIPVPSYQELMQDMPEEEIVIEDIAGTEEIPPEEETSDYRKDLENVLTMSWKEYTNQKIAENHPNFDDLPASERDKLERKYLNEYNTMAGERPDVGKFVTTTKLRPNDKVPITDEIQKDMDATIAAGGKAGYDDKGDIVMEAGKSGEGFSGDVITGEGTEDEDAATTAYNYDSPLTGIGAGTANAGTEVKESFYPYALTGLQAGYNILAPMLAKKFRGEDYVGDPSYMDAIDYDLSEERRELQREAAGARKNLKNIAGGVGAGAYLTNLGSMYDRFRRGVAGSYARENLLETQANMEVDKYNRMLDAQRARDIASINYGEDAQRRANILEGTTAALEQLKYPLDIRRGEQAGIDLTNAYLGEGSPYRMTYSTIGDQIRNRRNTSAYGGYLPKKKKNG